MLNHFQFSVTCVVQVAPSVRDIKPYTSAILAIYRQQTHTWIEELHVL